MLRILRWGAYPGLFRWAQYNYKAIYKKDKEVIEGHVMKQTSMMEGHTSQGM